MPEWLRPSVLDWLWPLYYNGQRLRQEVLRKTQVALRFGDEEEGFVHRLMDEDDFLLDVVDFQLAQLRIPSPQNVDLIRQLTRVFDDAGSAWRVSMTGGTPHLEQRVDQTVATATSNVMETAGRAGEHLARAWLALYGRSPDAGKAYLESVKAVEAAAIPVYLPPDKTATLGKVIGHLKANKASIKSKLAPQGAVVPADVLLGMFGLLWHSQWDRHGVPDNAAGFQVSKEEAEAAVHLAAALVHWLSAGAFGV